MSTYTCCCCCCPSRLLCGKAGDELEQVWVVLFEEGRNVVQPLSLRHAQQLRSSGSGCHCRRILCRHTCCSQLLLLLLVLLLLLLVLLLLPGCVLPMHCRGGRGWGSHAADRAGQLVVQVGVVVMVHVVPAAAAAPGCLEG
jgi:hypothetical protein